MTETPETKAAAPKPFATAEVTVTAPLTYERKDYKAGDKLTVRKSDLEDLRAAKVIA